MAELEITAQLAPGALLWADRFAVTLPAWLDLAAAAGLEFFEDTVRRVMDETFEVHDPGGPLATSLHGAPLSGLPGQHGFVAEIGRGVPYALQREFGGTILPKDPSGTLRFQTYDGLWHRVRAVTQEGSHYWEMAIAEAWEPEQVFFADAVYQAMAVAIGHAAHTEEGM